jgi:CBS domain-containing protein
MDGKIVKDLMIPISNYATVSENATLLDAMMALEESQQNVPEDLHPYRAVLVVDDSGGIVGKIGHLAFLRAIEPKYDIGSDEEKLTRANVSTEFIDSMMKHYELWDEDIFDTYSQVSQIKAGSVMNPVTESISYDASLQQAVHMIIKWHTLSMLVRQNNEIIGIIRLSDIYNEVTNIIKEAINRETKTGDR